MLQIDLWKRVLICGLCAVGLFLAMPNAFYTRVEQHNDAIALLDSGQSAPELAQQAARWPSFLPSSLVNLGLDLRGGAHLLADVQLADVYEARMQALWPEVRTLLRGERATIGTIRRQASAADEIRLRVSNPEAAPQAAQALQALARPVGGLSGATGALDLEIAALGDEITITLSEAEKQATDERTLRQALEIIRRRIDEVGTREPTIQRQGENRILIQVPGIGSAGELESIIGTTARLTFHPVVARGGQADTPAGVGNKVLPLREDSGSFYTVDSAPVVSGEELVDAQPGFDQNGRPAVTFRFNPAGARKFGDYTAENIGNPFAIVLDDEIISAPVIQDHIPGGSGIITGRFTLEETTNLAILLRAGALPAELIFIEKRSIGPELGQDSIDAGKIACIVAFVAVLVFMFLSYGMFGLFANVALIINVGLIFGLLSTIGATLTLPGIAGIVLTIGMAVDANVLIFERIREELASGKGPARAVQLGYERAFSAILDANVTTFITAAILFAMGSGPVRGFAITLGLGILTSVFSALHITRLMIVVWFEARRPRQIEV